MFNLVTPTDAIAGLVVGALAIMVLRSGKGQIENRVFGLFGIVMALNSFADAIVQYSGHRGEDTPAAAAWLWDLTFIAMPLVLLYFSTVFPRRRTFFGNTIAGPITVALGTAGLMALNLYAEGRFEQGDPGFIAQHFNQHAGLPSPLGFPFGFIGFVYILMMGGAALALLFINLTNARSDVDATRARYLIMGITVLVISTILALFVPFLGIIFTEVFLLTQALVTVTFGWLAAYAILKYQAFDVNLVIKKGIAYSVSFLILAIVWVVLGQIAQWQAADLVLSKIPLLDTSKKRDLASALLVFVLFTPIQAAVQRLMTKAIPRLGQAHDEIFISDKGQEIYRNALVQAWADGEVKGRERHVLAALRESLGISDAIHLRLEADVRDKLVLPPAAPRARAKPTATAKSATKPAQRSRRVKM